MAEIEVMARTTNWWAPSSISMMMTTMLMLKAVTSVRSESERVMLSFSTAAASAEMRAASVDMNLPRLTKSSLMLRMMVSVGPWLCAAGINSLRSDDQK